MPRRVLILGGHGFMGRWLIPHLRALGDEVVAPTRAEADVRSADALKSAVTDARPDVVINLAGISNVTDGDTETLYDVNTLGHLRLLLAVAHAAPAARVVLASTANLYGEGMVGRASSEEDAPAPKNHYANSKLAAEQLHPLFRNLDSCAVRPFNCIGRGQRPYFFVAKLACAFRRRDPEIKLGDTAVQRDLVDIRDVCVMWERLLAAPKAPHVINFGNGEPVAFADVIATLERLSDHHPHIARSEDIIRAADITYQRADTRIIAALGYRRRHGLEDTLAWMLAEESVSNEA
jgi:GDP-6-deoxy-D-talose 4-dehydrogenase